MPRSYCPRPQQNVVSLDARKLRNRISGFLPNIGLSMINYGRSAAIDRFYISCQNHRDYYKDFTGRMPRIHEFEMGNKLFASRPSPTEAYVSQPTYYIAERLPVVYPVTLQRRGRPASDGLRIRMDGQFDATPCHRYKR